MEVRAAVTASSGKPFELKTFELDDPRPDEILVRIIGVGVCHTDIVFNKAGVIPSPAVLGHKSASVVEKVGTNVRKVRRATVWR